MPGTMVHVRAGWFRMGSRPQDLVVLVNQLQSLELRPSTRLAVERILKLEIPERRVYVRAFSIDRTEVTRAAYARCVRARRCPAVAPPSRLGSFARPEAPMVNVTWAAASAYCRFAGKRLPTEAEWEKAARGPFGQVWPWGNRFHEKAFNHGSIHPVLDQYHGSASDGFWWVAPVGRFPFDRSYYGALDMAGNVAEWVADRFDPGYWSRGPSSPYNPTGPRLGGRHLVKGGSWSRLRILCRPAAKRVLPGGEQRAPDVGFRCAR